MKTWRVFYQVKVAPKQFYPRDIEVEAKSKAGARSVAREKINENTDFETIEKIIITKVEPI